MEQATGLSELEHVEASLGDQYNEFEEEEPIRSKRHIYLCGRRWGYGTDDFFFPSLLATAIRMTWLFFAVALVIFIEVQRCEEEGIPTTLRVSIFFFIVLQLVALANEFALLFFSTRGSLSNPLPRKKLVYFIYSRGVVFLIEAAWSVYTITVLLGEKVTERLECDAFRNAVFAHLGLLMLEVLLLAIVAVLFFGFLDPCGCCCVSGLMKNLRKYDKELDKNLDETHAGLHGNDIDPNLLAGRLRALVCCCCRRGGLNNSRRLAIADVTRALGLIFDDFEATFTDKVSGFFLAYQYQKRLERVGRCPNQALKLATVKLLKERRCVDQRYTSPPHRELEHNTELPNLLLYYLKFAMSTYGWPVGVYLSPCTAPISLCLRARGCCCCPYCQDKTFAGDKCFPNTVVITEFTGVEQEDVLDASFVNKVFESPFYVARVTHRKEVVVAVRGTLSLSDIMTDIAVSTIKLGRPLLGARNCRIHSGFLYSAENILCRLEENAIFKSLIEEKGYRVVITGHSLGAGVAAVLAMLLKDHHPDWSHDLKAYLFATPGCVCNYELAEKTVDFIFSVVIGRDMVPRMTMRSIAYLKMTVEKLLDSAEVSKHQLLCCGGLDSWWCRILVSDEEDLINLNALAVDKEEEEEEEEEEEGGGDIQTESYRRLKFYQPWTVRYVGKRKSLFGERKSTKKFLQRLTTIRRKPEESRMMFIPGSILHIQEDEEIAERRCCGLKRERRVRGTWKSREDFTTILVHRDMFQDHAPRRTLRLVQLLEKQLGQHADEPTGGGQHTDEPTRGGQHADEPTGGGANLESTVL